MRVAVVTGGNKGIGLGIVRGLCKKFEGTVYLTSRDVTRGEEAVNLLKGEGLTPSYHQLDIGDQQSVEKLRDYMKEKYGGIDVLVNNAAIAFKGAAPDPFGHQATVTLRTNYWDTKRACQILYPVLKAGARVVNLSSSAGFLPNIGRSGDQTKASELRQKLASETITVAELDALMKNFDETANAGNHGDHGWPNSTYVVSKVGLSCLSRIQQRQLSQDRPDDDIVVNHVHPGYVDTDMTSHKGPLTIDRGAESSLFAALLPPQTGVRGAYIWHDCQIVDWVNGPTPPMT